MTDLQSLRERGCDPVTRIASKLLASKAWPMFFEPGSAEKFVRFVLTEIREPTPEMVAAALPKTDTSNDPELARIASKACFILQDRPVDPLVAACGRHAALELIRDWHSMIDAALQSSKPAAVSDAAGGGE